MSSSLFKQIDSSILEFCGFLAEKYEIDQQEIFALWKGDDKAKSETKKVVKSTSTSESESSTVELTLEKIMTSSKTVLMAFCKAKGVVQSGRKEDIVERLTALLNKPVEESASAKAKPAPAKKGTLGKTLAAVPVLSSLSEKSGSFEIRKNKFGNYEHFDTGLVFNNDTKTVIGHQNVNGKVDSLTDKDIETCKKFKFTFKLPENLSTSNGLTSVKVDEVDEEEEELDEDDIDEEEEDVENEVDLEED